MSAPPALKARYMGGLQDVIPDVRDYITLCEQGGGAPRTQEQIAFLAHRLSGSGATMGFPAISTAASGLEALLEHMPAFSPAAASGARKLLLACEAALAGWSAAEAADAQEMPPVVAPALVMLHQDPALAGLIPELNIDTATAGSAEDAAPLLGPRTRLLLADLDAAPGEAIAALFARAVELHIPILALAGNRRQAALSHAASQGRARILMKPLDAKNLTETVGHMVRQGRLSVILADDDAVVREFLKTKFEAHGFAVTLAGDGDEVLALARKEPPSIIVLDRAMPKMEGLTALRLLKSDPATHAVPVLLLTRKSSPEQVTEGLHDGAAGYMMKPFSPDAVVARCEEILLKEKP